MQDRRPQTKAGPNMSRTYQRTSYDSRVSARRFSTVERSFSTRVLRCSVARRAALSRSLIKVADWLERKGWTLYLARPDLMARPMAYAEFAPEFEVRIDQRLAPRSQLYMALHECGHVLIGEHRKTPRPIDQLAEEIEAWNRGRKLARRLRIPVDAHAWRSLRNRCLVSYARAV
jgi:hypothetical protein